MKLTSFQFIAACLRVFPALSVSEVARLFKDGLLPAKEEIGKAAEHAADSLTPDISTLPAHSRLMAIIDWAKQ